ncbi:MAG: histidine phosphatase family protein [Erysipelotrichaceae bacterium]|nr:histidine phosphatase family protein [Erysipelotrichaceae bacterium]
MIHLYLLRHGETEHNLNERVQGWNDSPLTELGLFQARCTGYGLRNVIFEKAYSGDCLRQINTAKTVLSENLHETELIPDPHFREMCYGKYEDGTYYDMLNPLYEMKNAEYDGYDGLYRFYSDIDIAAELVKRDETQKFEGTGKAWQRLSEGLEMIFRDNREGNILISTSSMAICSMIHHLFPDFIQPRLVSNASITVISYDGTYHLDDYNNTEYKNLGEQHFRYVH